MRRSAAALFLLLTVSSVFATAVRAASLAPTDLDQYLLELTNRARANPIGEAATFGIPLNEGLPVDTISAAAKQPLAFNPALIDSATGHSQWMLSSDTFSHIGAAGSGPGDRMAASGYAFAPPWAWGENIGWEGQTILWPNTTTTTAQIHKDLFLDVGIADRGHRINMLNPSYREVGIGIVPGTFHGYNAVMVSEDLALTAGNAFLTGVVYNDALLSNFYSPTGEGYGGVAVTATNTANGAIYRTTTFGSGGYSLQVPAGTYHVDFAGGSLGDKQFDNIFVGADNVKLDVRTVSATNLWTNLLNPYDVNGDHKVNALDARYIINELRLNGQHSLLGLPLNPTRLFDVNGDNSVTTADAILVINEIKHPTISGLGLQADSGFSAVPEPAGLGLAAGSFWVLAWLALQRPRKRLLGQS